MQRIGWPSLAPASVRRKSGYALARAASWASSNWRTPALPSLSNSASWAFAEGGFLARALQFDEFAGGIHHHVEIHRRADILGVAQVQQRLAVHDADAHGGDGVQDGIFGKFAARRSTAGWR